MHESKLFEPFSISNMNLRNRIVMGPMGTGMARDDGAPSERQVEYYVRRASGGVGLLIVEHAFVQKRSCRGSHSLGFWDERTIDAWRKLTDAVHREGAKIAVEVGHMGRSTDYGLVFGMPAVSASPLRCHALQVETAAATEAEMVGFLHDYAKGVRMAVDAGFDAVELHFTNGYFLASFLSGRTNIRMDCYGGNLENRLRFPLELISVVRSVVGPYYPLLARLAAKEPNDGRSVEETSLIACAFEEAGINCLDINAGSVSDYDWEFPSYYKEQGFLLNDIEKIKKSVSIPIIGGGRIVEPRMAEQALRQGRLDLVSIARGLLADPDWPIKVSAGKSGEIRRCIACTRCIHEKEMDGIVCSVNPYVGRETKLPAKPADKVKRVLVVGGGPAGLQASIVLAERGHHVVLAEREGYLGGMISSAAVPPKKWEIAGIITTLAELSKRVGVEIRLNCDVDEEFVISGLYDGVLLACGAEAILPTHGIAPDMLLSAVDVLNGSAWPGKNAVIVGGGMIGCECAEFLSAYGIKITIIEMKSDVAREMYWNVRGILLDRLRAYGVDFICNAKVTQAQYGAVDYELNGKQHSLHGVDHVIFAVGLRSSNQLKKSLDRVGITSIEVGDCCVVARLRESLVDAVEKAIKI